MAIQISPFIHSFPCLIVCVAIFVHGTSSYSMVPAKRYGDYRVPHAMPEPIMFPPQYPVMEVDEYSQKQAVGYPIGIASPAYASPDYSYTQDYFDQPDYYNTPETDTYNNYPYYEVAPPKPAIGSVKYVYQPQVLPYYYRTEHKPTYGYFSYEKPKDPVDYIEKEIHEEEREERGDLPVGREIWYQREVPPRIDEDEQDAFAKNLFLDEVYSDMLAGERNYYNPSVLIKQGPLPLAQQYGNYDDYSEGSDDDTRAYQEYQTKNGRYYTEKSEENSDNNDEEVKELKSLVAHKKSVMSPRYQEISMFPNAQGSNLKPSPDGEWSQTLYDTGKYYKKKQESSAFGPWIPPQGMPITFTDRKATSGLNFMKPQASIPVTTTNPPQTTTVPPETTSQAAEFDPKKGQKEVPLFRPGNPAHRPGQGLGRLMIKSSPNHPSVYDTIKQLLSMEKELRKEPAAAEHSKPQKRFVSNEESLVQQLSGLKKFDI